LEFREVDAEIYYLEMGVIMIVNVNVLINLFYIDKHYKPKTQWETQAESEKD